jgi:hypothetical protein
MGSEAVCRNTAARKPVVRSGVIASILFIQETFESFCEAVSHWLDDFALLIVRKLLATKGLGQFFRASAPVLQDDALFRGFRNVSEDSIEQFGMDPVYPLISRFIPLAGDKFSSFFSLAALTCLI